VIEDAIRLAGMASITAAAATSNCRASAAKSRHEQNLEALRSPAAP